MDDNEKMSRIWILLLTAATLCQGQPVKTANTRKFEGYFNFYWDEKAGKVLLEIKRWKSEFLYINSLPAGLGSNDIGLDRGQLGSSRIVRFERVGPKVLLIEPNHDFRAETTNPDEQRAVRDSFAESTLWGFQVESECGDGCAVVDATAFFLRDAHGVTERLQRARQGTYRLDPTRSAFYLDRTRNFPKNTEVEATLTFTGEPQGALIREVTPSPEAITVRQHHSFVELPGPGYTPRPMDPRAGYFGIRYFDYATPIAEPIRKQFINRHRLTPSKPIVYYLDRGTPEPIRSALLEGARWWAQAFEAAGHRDAYKVEVMPEDADPMDIRYNVIQWVHRSTRGWSYGATVSDPRTGEIIKGHVTLGSLRVRQDYLIAEGLLAPYEEGKPVPPAMLEMSLARLRQLSAHEVGHTLGLSHNYVSSAAKNASVMDYPHPMIGLKDSVPTVDHSYETGIGEWDKVAITWGYSDLDAAGRNALLDAAHKKGLYFISDMDSRPEGSAHPTSHLWDNGADAAVELKRIMEVRAKALARFSAKNIPVGRPLSTLQESLVTTYLLHRYQVEAAAKMLGGLHYTYALRGDGQQITKILPAADQRRALDALLTTIDPAALTISERILQLIPPAAPGFARTREYFRSRTGLTFDPIAAAETAASATISMILHPERATRLIQYHARDASNPHLMEVIDRLTAATWKRQPAKGLDAEVGRAIDQVFLYHLTSLAVNEGASAQARAIAALKLDQLKEWLVRQAPVGQEVKAHYQYGAQLIRKWQEDPKPAALPKLMEPPPGMPIGSM